MDKYFSFFTLSVANLKQSVEFLALIFLDKPPIIILKLNWNLYYATKITILYKDGTVVTLGHGNHFYYSMGDWFLQW